MKREMLDAIKGRFNGIEENKYAAIATLVDPHFKDKFFSGYEQRENAKLLLMEELKKELDTREERPVSLEPTERPCKRQKIWEVCAEIIEESGGRVTDEKPEQELYLSEPLIELEVDTCLWWGDNAK